MEFGRGRFTFDISNADNQPITVRAGKQQDMKRIGTCLIIVLMVSLNTTVRGVAGVKKPLQSAVLLSASGQLHVLVDNNSNRPVLVRVLNKKGETVAVRTIGLRASPGPNGLNLVGLEAGFYRVEISNGEVLDVQQVHLTKRAAPKTTARTFALN